MLWLVGLFTFEPLPDHPLVAFVAGSVNLFTGAGQFLVLVALAIGGWKLRALQPSAITWVKTSLWLDLGLITVALAAQIWVAVLEVEHLPDAPTTPLEVGDGLLLAIFLISLVFEISALVWLHRRGTWLKSFCTAGMVRGPQGTLVMSSGTVPAGRGRVLKWVALALLVCAVGLVSLITMLILGQNYFSETARKETATTAVVASPEALSAVVASPEAAASAPWIQFTFTAVELREVDGKRWLAIDYLDEVHGDCQKSFPWESKIPGHRPETRTSEFAKDVTDPRAARHQRIEYLLPDSTPREPLEQLRSNVEKALKQKTIRLELGQEKLLFEFGSSSETALKAWIKVIPPSDDAP
jgi:hypothetical protein